MNIWITGGAWVTATGHGMMSEGRKPVLSAGTPDIPAARDIFSRPVQRYGRFDTYTKLGCASVALTLKDAGLDSEKKGCIGVIVSTLHEVMETDLAYYKTTIEQDGALAGPNLFSYTLPVIAIGECAALFNLTGPTFCVGEENGLGINALKNAIEMLYAGKADKMIAGWIDSPPKEENKNYKSELISGAIFVILEKDTEFASNSQNKIMYDHNKVIINQDLEIYSLQDLF